MVKAAKWYIFKLSLEVPQKENFLNAQPLLFFLYKV